MLNIKSVLILLVAVLSLSLANTEVLTFSIDRPSETHNEEGLALLPSLTPLEPRQSQFEFGEFTDEHTIVYSVNSAAPAGKYCFRLCWPASAPADISLSFDDMTQTIRAVGSSRNYVELGAAHRSTSSNRIVPFEVHLSPMKFGLIPEDVIPIVKRVAIVFVLAALVAIFGIRKLDS